MSILHQLAFVLLELCLHSDRHQLVVDLLELLLAVVVMLQEQRDGHRHQVERRLVIGHEALHDLARRAKECQHVVDGMPFQVKESVVANVGRVLVHDVVKTTRLLEALAHIL